MRRTTEALKEEGFGVLTKIDVVAAIDPVASMLAIDNPRLKQAAEQVRDKLQSLVSRL